MVPGVTIFLKGKEMANLLNFWILIHLKRKCFLSNGTRPEDVSCKSDPGQNSLVILFQICLI